MKEKSFLFDINKCVGCHACLVACVIENKTLPETQWRQISSFNPMGFPDIPLLHFSLACNHCDNPPCLKNCPALAYSKDISTGIVHHIATKCIGCKYCTWACPYDAPKFNKRTRIIEKCTFCKHRFEDELKPACANHCPTGALDFIDKTEVFDNQGIPGFTNTGIQPSIKIIPVRKEKQQLVVSEIQDIPKIRTEYKKESKITLKSEWPLAIFTLIASILVSIFTAAVFFKLTTDPYIFLATALIGIVLSLFHLGKKFRAWRTILNLRNSWLSREILFFALFWVFRFVQCIVYQHNVIAYLGVICGILALISVDKVYKLAIQPTRVEVHSAHVVLTYLLFTALFSENYNTLIFIIAVKAGLYIYRKQFFKKHTKNQRLFLTAFRLDMIISFPFLFWFFDIPNLFWWLTASIAVGEIIDRCEYYDELDVITPKKQIEKDLLEIK